MNGKRLKDHMMKKNNGTLIQPLFGQRSTLSQNPAAANLLSQFLPGLMKNSHAGRDVAAGSQLLGSLAQNFPAIRDIPGLSGLTKGGSFGGPFNNMRSSGSESPIDQVSINY
jgi:hypothetical protein